VKVRVFERVPFASSSSEKDEGLRPPPAVKEKSWASSGWESLTTTRVARLRLENVQVTASPGARLTFAGGLPSSQVAEVWSQPPGTVSASE
jgi:hypothetical protein